MYSVSLLLVMGLSTAEGGRFQFLESSSVVQSRCEDRLGTNKDKKQNSKRRCQATNSKVKLQTHSVRFVYVAAPEDQIPHGFPTIDMGPQLKVVERTRTATMLCAASGTPDPEIFWFKDFFPVDISSSNGRIKQLRSGTVPVHDACTEVFRTSMLPYSGFFVF